MNKILEKFIDALLKVLIKQIEKLLNSDIDGDEKIG